MTDDELTLTVAGAVVRVTVEPAETAEEETFTRDQVVYALDRLRQTDRASVLARADDLLDDPDWVGDFGDAIVYAALSIAISLFEE